MCHGRSDQLSAQTASSFPAMSRLSFTLSCSQAQRLQQLQQQGQWPGMAFGAGGGAGQIGYLSQQQQQHRLAAGAAPVTGQAPGAWGGAQSQLPPSAFAPPARAGVRPQGVQQLAAAGGIAAHADRWRAHRCVNARFQVNRASWQIRRCRGHKLDAGDDMRFDWG